MEKEAEKLLTNIHLPADLRRLPVKELPRVCEELRQTIIEQLADNPGHFASSLGVVELTVALHYVFNTPYDRLVWDVGHQASGHKILTGRKERFSTYRHLHGLRPFPSPEESEYDTFACGHASNSISAALGMAVAAHKNGEEDRHVVAIIGDGSMSGGLAFEGLNNVSVTPNNLLIILNDNNMSNDFSELLKCRMRLRRFSFRMPIRSIHCDNLNRTRLYSELRCSRCRSSFIPPTL